MSGIPQILIELLGSRLPALPCPGPARAPWPRAGHLQVPLATCRCPVLTEMFRSMDTIMGMAPLDVLQDVYHTRLSVFPLFIKALGFGESHIILLRKYLPLLTLCHKVAMYMDQSLIIT